MTLCRSIPGLAFAVCLVGPVGAAGSAIGASAASAASAIGASQCRGVYDCKLDNPHPSTDRSCGGVNRLRNPADGGCSFLLAEATPLVDGDGNIVGTAAVQRVSFNYGQRKTIEVASRHGVYLFALGVRLNEKKADDTPFRVSGWIREDAVQDVQGLPGSMPTLAAIQPAGPWRRHFIVTGGAPALATRFGELKISPRAPLGPNTHQNVGDYLLRPTPAGGVVNFLYALPGSGGVATDTFPVGQHFTAADGVPERKLALFDGHDRVPTTLSFLYGRVEYAKGRYRYGWIARWAIAPA